MTKKIEMSKVEAKAAGKPSTNEYNTLLELLKNFPGYQIEIVKTSSFSAMIFRNSYYQAMTKHLEFSSWGYWKKKIPSTELHISH